MSRIFLDTAASSRPLNLIGYPGAYLSDLCLQVSAHRRFCFRCCLWAGLEMDTLRRIARRRDEDRRRRAAIARRQCRAFLLPLRLFGARYAWAARSAWRGHFSGGRAKSSRRAVGDSYRAGNFPLPGFELRTRCYPALVRRPAAVLRRFALAWRLWRERRHARAVERARLRAARRALAAKNRADAELNKKPKKAKPATVAAPAMAAAADEAPPGKRARRPAWMNPPIRSRCRDPICPIEDLAPEPAPALVPPPTELPLAPPEPRA